MNSPHAARSVPIGTADPWSARYTELLELTATRMTTNEMHPVIFTQTKVQASPTAQRLWRIAIRWSHWRVLAILAGLMLAGPTAGNTNILAAQVDSQASAETQSRVERLIRQLGAPTYAMRQSAGEQLWELGPAARPALTRAAALGDSEVARRAGEMLTVMAMGIDRHGSPKIAKLVLHFHASEQNVRAEVLTRLSDEGEYQLVFDLLAQVKNKDDQSQLFDEVMKFDDTLVALARSDRWEDFEFILGHPLTFEMRPEAGVHYHLLNGSLDAKIEQLKKAIAAKENDGRKLDDAGLMRLIAIFRLQRNFKQAELYANKIVAVERRVEISNQLLLEQGDWDQIAARMTGPQDNAQPSDGKIIVTPGQRALVYQFVGDQAGYDATIQDLLNQAVAFEKDNDETGARGIRNSLIQIGLANLDWNLVESNQDLDDKFKSFQLFIHNNRTQQALGVIGLGEDVEQRHLWIDRRVRNIRSLEAKSKRLEENGQDNDQANSKLSQTWENSFQVAGLLGDLGLTDESVLFYQTLFAALEDANQKYRRYTIVQELIRLEQYDAAWKLIESGFDTRDYRQLVNYIFDNRSVSARFWYEKLKPRYPDPIVRLQATAGILNSPIGSIPNFDLRIELAAALSDSVESRLTDYYLAKVYEFHGDQELSRIHMAAARELGLSNAARAFAVEAVQRGDFELAIDYFDSAWKERSGCYESILAAAAYRQSGDLKRAMLRECLGFTFWRDSYRNSGTIMSLEAIKMSHLIRTFLQIETIRMDGTSIASERYRDELATALQSTEPELSAVNLQTTLYTASADEAGSRLTMFWPDTRKRINLAQAKTLISQGQFDEALEILQNYNRFCPGDPSVGEAMIAEFDKAGATEHASLLFETLTNPYFDILERYPDSSFHRNNYAWICACAKRRMNHMLRHSLIAAAQRPNSATLNDTLAEIYFLLGDRQRAIELSRRCIQINPAKQHYRDQLKRFSSAPEN